MRTIHLIPLACILLIGLTHCHPIKDTKDHPVFERYVPPPKNIILMVGDGMGLTQITAGMYSNNNRLELERFHSIGLHKQHSIDNLVTDSGAAATAFSCGKKTYYQAIGVDADTLPCKTLLEAAEERGFATGMVVTSTIVHATPAAFIAHTRHRNNYEEIAAAFPGSGIDFFVGGGLKFFQKRKRDNRDICAEMEQLGYVIQDYRYHNPAQIMPDAKRPFGFLTAENDPATQREGRDYLLPASLAGLHFLEQRSENGYFMMIEGSQIDWGGHDNMSDYIISEMLEFDQVVGRVLDYAEQHPGTLVIVTADHETGGYAILEGSTMNNLVTAFSTGGHTADLIPVFAYGPGAEKFQGIYENTALFHKIMAIMGW